MTFAIKKDINLDTISDEELLNTRLCDLPLTIKGTWLEDCVEELYKELAQKQIQFRPKCFLADEWLTPEKETCIGIPFYLAHPRLTALEKKYMNAAEGDGVNECLKLLRHEAGHAIYYAYKLHNRRKWQTLFGSSKTEYAETYKYRPYSRNFVRHLEGHYAQYHPEEDFVETFAVWLTPNLDWGNRYKGWKALEKLQYVDELMRSLKKQNPTNTSAKQFWRISTIKCTLKYFYKKKKQSLAEDNPDFHDPFLKNQFPLESTVQKQGYPADAIFKKYRRELINSVALISGEKKHTIDELLKSMQKRSRQLHLSTDEQESKVLLNVSSYITSLAKNYQYTGRYRGGN
ncbi:MAG: putative zinc-binding metallopeptidase [Candidatus Omnitrophica bacterium]|nr:putative zinc-binding metallopeptidase [Candidatus Omnitrophota bacterium]